MFIKYRMSQIGCEANKFLWIVKFSISGDEFLNGKPLMFADAYKEEKYKQQWVKGLKVLSDVPLVLFVVLPHMESNNMANVGVDGLSAISEGVQNNTVKMLKKYDGKVAKKDQAKKVVDSSLQVGHHYS